MYVIYNVSLVTVVFKNIIITSPEDLAGVATYSCKIYMSNFILAIALMHDHTMDVYGQTVQHMTEW